MLACAVPLGFVGLRTHAGSSGRDGEWIQVGRQLALCNKLASRVRVDVRSGARGDDQTQYDMTRHVLT